MDLSSLYDDLKGAASSAVDTATEVVEDVSSAISTAGEAISSSAGRAYLRQYVDKSEWGNEMFNEGEMEALKGVVADRIGAGGRNISYKHYDEEGGKSLGYGGGASNLANPATSVKMTLGKANIVRDGDSLYVADTYDFSGKGSKYKDAPLLERMDVLLEAFQDESVSTYGLLHLAAEMFGAKEGDGIPVRVKIGTLSEMGLEEDDVSYLEELSSYNSRVKDNRTPATEQPVKESVVKDTVIDTSKAFKRYGVIGGDATLDALRKAAGDNTISWANTFIGSDGKTYKNGDRVPKGIKLRVAR